MALGIAQLAFVRDARKVQVGDVNARMEILECRVDEEGSEKIIR